LQDTDALLVVDIQNDFMTSSHHKANPNYPIPDLYLFASKTHIRAGSLAVANTDEIIDPINKVVKAFEDKDLPTFFSLDWHPANHCSFCRNGTAISNPLYYKKEGGFCGPLNNHSENNGFIGLEKRCQDTRSKQDFENTALGMMQWPDHSEACQYGSRFYPYLYVPKTAQVIRKGFEASMDAFSAFEGVMSEQEFPFDTCGIEGNVLIENEANQTLQMLLEETKSQRLFIVGIATDYTVKWSAIDAMNIVKSTNVTAKPSSLKEVHVVLPLTRWVAENTRDEAIDAMSTAGATIIRNIPFSKGIP